MHLQIEIWTTSVDLFPDWCIFLILEKTALREIRVSGNRVMRGLAVFGIHIISLLLKKYYRISQSRIMYLFIFAAFTQYHFNLMKYNSILLHNGLNPAWHFWLSTRCLKMKSVENILGYIREQFYRSPRGCKPRENLWNCSRKYTKTFNTDSFLDNKKLKLNQNVWRDHATMQQDVF